MNEHEKSSHKPDRKRRGPHVEPSRLQQVEEAIHRLTKKVGKLNREQRDMRADYENELAALQETRAALADEIRELVNQAIQKTRAMVRGLVPVRLEDTGFMAAVQQYCNAVQKAFDIQCQVVA